MIVLLEQFADHLLDLDQMHVEIKYYSVNSRHQLQCLCMGKWCSIDLQYLICFVCISPNTCRVQQSLQVNEVDYEYRKYCDWTYSKTYYAWVQQCQYVLLLLEPAHKLIIIIYYYRLICQPTRECSNRNQTIETSGVKCCEGFRPRPPRTTNRNNNYHHQHFTPIPTDPAGCPIGKPPSLE